jgi:hypothetical protein
MYYLKKEKDKCKTMVNSLFVIFFLRTVGLLTTNDRMREKSNSRSDITDMAVHHDKKQKDKFKSQIAKNFARYPRMENESGIH